MHVPKIEDGNNFGVAVQEEVLSELGRCEDFNVQSLAISTKYYLTRAKILAKVRTGISLFLSECAYFISA